MLMLKGREIYLDDGGPGQEPPVPWRNPSLASALVDWLQVRALPRTCCSPYEICYLHPTPSLPVRSSLLRQTGTLGASRLRHCRCRAGRAQYSSALRGRAATFAAVNFTP